MVLAYLLSLLVCLFTYKHLSLMQKSLWNAPGPPCTQPDAAHFISPLFSDYFLFPTIITRWRHVFVAVVRVRPCVVWALWSVFAWKYRYFWMKPLSAAVQSVGGDKDIIVISHFIFVQIIVHNRWSKRNSVFNAWCWLSKKHAHFTVDVFCTYVYFLQ